MKERERERLWVSIYVKMNQRKNKKSVIQSKIKTVDSLYLFNYAPGCCNLKRQAQPQLQPSQTSGFASSPLPETSDRGKKKHFNTTHLQSPSNMTRYSQVKLLLSVPGEQKPNTPQFKNRQTTGTRGQAQKIMEREQNSDQKPELLLLQ